MSNRLKPPKDNAGPRIQPTNAGRGSVLHLKPKFSLENLSKSHCLSACSNDEKAAFADRLHEMSQLTWQQINNAPRHGQGSETIVRDAIKGSPIPSCITEDVKIISFRCIGKAPMVGYKVDEVFYVVWIDRAFDLYKH